MAVVDVKVERCSVRPWEAGRMRREGWQTFEFGFADLFWVVGEFGLSRGLYMWWWYVWNVPCVRLVALTRHTLH